ncbi:uncharacterized protein LOC141900098 [Tubulanus polymorphus]|uniref:uncharacterized protein LOC141900098 n=1 Tax=Tubulanus polymorphus TaxID=672921 RepID=UPI003DA3EAB5
MASKIIFGLAITLVGVISGCYGISCYHCYYGVTDSNLTEQTAAEIGSSLLYVRKMGLKQTVGCTFLRSNLSSNESLIDDFLRENATSPNVTVSPQLCQNPNDTCGIGFTYQDTGNWFVYRACASDCVEGKLPNTTYSQSFCCSEDGCNDRTRNAASLTDTPSILSVFVIVAITSVIFR